MQLKGTIPPMVTPTEGRDGGIDTTTLESYTNHLIDGGVYALFPCGSTGEFSSLTREEHRLVIETVVESADGLPVLAGCNGTSVDQVVTLINDAHEVGADAVVVVTPYYLTTTQTGLREFYEVVAARSVLPVVLYNIPHLTGNALSVETAATLAEHENVIGIKDSSGDVNYHYRLIDGTPDDFSVLQGATGLALASLEGGGDGIVPGVANVFPGALAGLYDAHRNGDHARAIELAGDIVTPLLSAYDRVSFVSALKYLVSLTGHEVGPPLLPLPELSDTQRHDLQERYETIAQQAAQRY
jgi:4-hydroxy-tetrahydrodipicolinate synthase